MTTPSLSAPSKSPSLDEPAWLWQGHIPSLDGLRGLAILLVLAAHVAGTGNFPGARRWETIRHGVGATGVTLFFVLSGFLITLLLLREQRRTETISLIGFYRRRALRILPAYAVFLLGLLLLQVGGVAALSRGDWASALTYTVNFRSGVPWQVGHIWSLSVEEHFYLVWPFLFRLVSIRWATLAATGWVVVTPMLRFIVWCAYSDTWIVASWTFTCSDAIAIGCCLAFLASNPGWRRRLSLSSGCALLTVVVATGSLLGNQVVSSSWTVAPVVVFSRTVDALSFVAIIWVAVHHSHGLLGRVLSWKPLTVTGLLAYSLYLWQQPLLNHHRGDLFICRWPQNLFLAAGLAVLSYRFIEMPFLRLKGRYEKHPQFANVSISAHSRSEAIAGRECRLGQKDGIENVENRCAHIRVAVPGVPHPNHAERREVTPASSYPPPG